MNTRRWCSAAATAVALTWGVGNRITIAADTPAKTTAAKAQSPDAKAAQVELADRFEQVALSTVEQHTTLPSAGRQTAAMLQAASRLNPREPRYFRLMYEARLSASDAPGAIAALNAYLSLVPDDQFAQTKLINLYVSRMQTVDSILAYLRNVVAKTVLPAPVRAHAAVVCAQTLLDHAQRDQALKMINVALQIEPLCASALRLKYQLTPDDAPSRRCGLLLAMLRSNPINPEAAVELANQLASLGLSDQSAVWYVQAAKLYNVSGAARSPQLAKGGATELYLCDHAVDAAKLIESYLASVPSDAQAWAIRLAIVKDLGTQAGNYDDLARQAVAQVTTRLQEIRAQFAAPNSATQPSPFSTATTQPVPEVPDIAGDMTLLVKANQPQLTDSYLSAVGDVAWLRLYFLRDAGDATQRLLDGLARLLPADDPLLVRLTGWNYLVRGQWDAARQKLSAVSDRDPYAALGMVLIDDQAGQKTSGDALARSSLAAHPSGAPAAVLFSALRSRGAAVIPGPQADLVKAAVVTFPSDWFNIIDHPQEFYTVTAEAVEGQVNYTQSILARVTIQNSSAFDITMGEEGTIRPDLVFDAAARGLVEKQMPSIAYDRFWQRLLLVKGQSASQVVRLDRGELSRLLETSPDLPISLQFSVMLNPVAAKDGPTIGGAGESIPFGRMIERSSTPFATPEDRTALYDQVAKGTPVQRLRAIETIATLERGLRTAANGAAGSPNMNVVNEMLQHAQPAAKDSDPSVKAWASYMATIIALPEQQPDLVRQLTQSDDWFARLLGLLAARRLPDRGAGPASVMSSDPDPIVKDYAAAMSDYIAATAAQAATQPSSGQ